ncbi:hypothetical protein MNBD_ALPHA06-530 [hydrothermal vent metagenome]|uniref:Methyltransferase type 11 domain-containing protein n=1 Tax=hydrothermal vent metagenome TaxID=652676 RepID=A0A3B0SPR3_9ZZZZ
MYPDVRELSQFYQTRLGKMVETCISRRLAALWPDIGDKDVLSVGYGSSFLPPWQTQARRLVNAMPARQGVEQWPAQGPVQSVLIDPLALPFADNCFDRILVAHFLEEAADPLASLFQLTDCLVSGGKMVLVLPHRIGLWAANSNTPFGHGRAYSYFQVLRLLEQTGLKCTARTQALFAPPYPWFAAPANTKAWERTGEIFWPFFGGALLVEAQKIRMIDPRTPKTQPVYCPEPSA